MPFRIVVLAVAAAICAFALPMAAHAQRTSENAVTEADDAFGTSVGLESTGIYTERNTRGFSPLEAGNVRIDGIYFDQTQSLSGRLRKTTAIRVGFSAIDFPFIAPTGVVDHEFNAFPEDASTSVTYNRYYYGGHIAEWDFHLPISEGKVGLGGGFAEAETRQADGSDQLSWGFTLRPIIRVGGFEIAPYAAYGKYTDNPAKPILVVRDGYLPEPPPRRKYLGQAWASGKRDIGNYGVTAKGRLSDRMFFRGGLFYSNGDRKSNFSEIYNVVDETGLANHILIADPAHDIHSTSGEFLVGLRLGGGRFRHRLFAGYRMRDRVTDTGGSADPVAIDPVDYGEIVRIPKPDFTFGEPDRGIVRQSSVMAGYIAHFADRLHINLGLQKGRYRGISIDGETDERRISRADPWLYNATVMAELGRGLSVYAATQRGLEDSGIAPENAANRDAQLPATKTTQYEGGVKWDFGRNHLVVAAFQIEKPYFTFDTDENFVALGTRRHRGLEASFSGHFGERLNLLAGAVVMQPEVVGLAGEQVQVGEKPAGVPDVYAQLDANYRTDIFGGLTLTGTLNYTGKRAVTSRPIDHLGDRQLMLPGWLRVDMGMRHRFMLSGAAVLVRASLLNVFDEKHWSVVASDVLLPEERRRALVTLAVDF